MNVMYGLVARITNNWSHIMHTIFKSIVKKEYKKSTNILNISAKHLFLIIFCGADGKAT